MTNSTKLPPVIHFHAHDWINDTRHQLANAEELDRYLQATVDDETRASLLEMAANAQPHVGFGSHGQRLGVEPCDDDCTDEAAS